MVLTVKQYITEHHPYTHTTATCFNNVNTARVLCAGNSGKKKESDGGKACEDGVDSMDSAVLGPLQWGLALMRAFVYCITATVTWKQGAT